MLTESQIKAAKPRTKAQRLTDGEGMYVEVRPTGKKIFRVTFRSRGEKHKKTHTLGEYPALKLAKAREMARRVKHLARSGVDLKRADLGDDAQTPAADSQLWETNCEEFIAKRKADGISPLTFVKLERNLRRTYQDFAARDIATIRPSEVLEIVRRLEAAELFDTAKDVRQKMSQVFRFAAAQDRCLHDPASVITIATVKRKHTKRPGLTDPKKVGGLLLAIHGYEGGPQTRAGLLLSGYCFLRSTELRAGRWCEIDWERRRWTIPEARTKGDHGDHIVPLSDQALGVLKWLHALSGNGELMFPAPRSDQKCISDVTLNAALRRMGYCTKTEHTHHGFRSTFSTNANEGGWNRDWIEKQLSHEERNEVRGAYNAAEYLEQRSEMMQWWADWLGEQMALVRAEK
ncbi:integrase arm-type DNA-binding domain-containing protein [Shimia sp.]|uniref:tyrosine-type recombinase/integrase n=1 Tax=Shimia sp. TaxID=1954381 RepID=UPI003296B368